MFGVGTATISRYVVQYGLKWPVKKRLVSVHLPEIQTKD